MDRALPEATGRRKAAPTPFLTLEAYCPVLTAWPQRWHFDEHDLAVGQALLELFTPFLQHLLDHSGLTRKTLQRHRDNLWLLGGDLIRRLQDEPTLRKRPVQDTLLELLDDDEGGAPDLSTPVRGRSAQRR